MSLWAGLHDPQGLQRGHQGPVAHQAPSGQAQDMGEDEGEEGGGGDAKGAEGGGEGADGVFTEG